MLTQSAVELATFIRERRLSSSEVVEAHIARIQEVNPVLNAVVYDCFGSAKKAAEEADKTIEEAHRKGEVPLLPPLLGVPCTIKENFEMAGTPQASGLMKRRHIINKDDAITVSRLKGAGAVPLGVTNTSELCMWMESYNKVYGRSNNPYDPTRTVGGSSGGEGAIIGAGASPFGLGADVGGSIRMPAFFNGVFGHKCSSGLIPNQGQYPLARGKGQDYLSTGPLCRRAQDLAPLVRIMAGAPGALADTGKVDIRKVRVVKIVPDRGPKASGEQLDARDRAIEALRSAGASYVEVDLPELDHAFDIWSSTLSAGDSNSFAEMMFESRNPLWPALELFKLPIGRSAHTLPLVMLALLEHTPHLLPGRAKRFVAMGQRLRAKLDQVLGDNGVLIYNPYPEVAPRHYKPLLPPFNFVRCAIFNAMELPATQIPMGLNKQGLPTGVQAIGAHGKDHLTIAVAEFLEQAIGGWVPPWQVNR